jgi:hypothetical protein
VKCDETKPHCKRCISGKRKCDGYEIVIHVPRGDLHEFTRLEYKRRVSDIQPKPIANPSILPNLDPPESRNFELFRTKIIPEFAGLRSNGFWRDLVLPACYSEPAVLHASLALSSAHKYRAEQYHDPCRTGAQNFLLNVMAEYNKAIRSLNKYIREHADTGSLRVILITCVCFIVLELYGGCVEKATMHLDEGRKLLLQLARTRNSKSTAMNSENEVQALYFAPKPESVDDRLVNIFAHIDLQSIYFGSERPLLRLTAHESYKALTKGPGINLHPSIFLDIPAHFFSLHEANQHLIILTNECLRFSGRTFDQTKQTIRNHNSNCRRRYLSSCLREWRQAYKQSCFTTTQLEEAEMSWKSQSALMLIQHAWLTIVIATSYLEVEETELDCLIGYFTTIVNLTAFVYSPEGEGMSANRKHFALELSIALPLWWTVMKCRHPKIRRKALWLLSLVGCEGFWDPIIMRQMGIETVLLEERAELQPMIETSECFPLDQDATFDENTDLGAFIPLRRRISGATLSFGDTTQQTIQMTFKRKRRNDENTWTGEFDLITVERSLQSFIK